MSGGRGSGEQLMVPRATFESYYGRPVLKPPVWKARDVAGYLFTGGIAAGSALLAAGGDLTGRPELRRAGRLSALGFLGISTAALVDDLGVPSKFYNMLRVAKPTSPMSVGSWILSAFALPVGVAAAAELRESLPLPSVARSLLGSVERPAGLAAAAVAPAVATYTAVLICDTAVPAWNAAYPEMPFVFAGSALSGSAGLALALVACPQNAPARRLAILGSAVELAASQRIEHRLGLVGEPYSEGAPGRKMRLAKAMTAAGALAGFTLGGRSRAVGFVAGASLVAASALTRLAIFQAGVASAKDPKYTVQPQRDRLERRDATGPA